MGSVGEPLRAPVVLVHGAFAGSWIWEDGFLDRIARTGRTVHTIDLRKQDDDAVETAASAGNIGHGLGRFEIPPVVVAHSLGALLVQRLLGRVKISGLVMLAPVPPEGMLFTTPGLFATEPALWVGAWGFLTGQTEAAFSSMANVLFSRNTSSDDRRRHVSRMTFESVRTIIEAHAPMPVMPAFLIGVPTLVIAGTEDALISPLACARTAIYHGSEYRSEPELGHLLQVGPSALRLADSVIDWLERRDL